VRDNGKEIFLSEIDFDPLSPELFTLLLLLLLLLTGRDSSVVIATGHWLDGLGNESQWWGSFPHQP